MKWIEIKDKKPEEYVTAWVCNTRSSSACFIAYYNPDTDVWRWSKPELYSSPAIDVTHWYPLPNPPSADRFK